MRKTPVISRLLMAAAIALAAGTIWVTAYALQAQPVILKYPEAAQTQARSFLDAVSAGDYEAASEYLYGTPSLGLLPEDLSPAAGFIWLSFLDSLDYTFLGECYLDDSGLAIDAEVTSLDVSSLVLGLNDRAAQLLGQRVDAAEDSSEIYDETNNYRQELVEEVLYQAVRQELVENTPYQDQTVTLHLVCDQGQWWVLPEAELLNVLSGSIAG